MAVKSARRAKSSQHRQISKPWIPTLFRNPKVASASALLVFDAVLTALIIAYVPYTKIDWDAYMSQVSGFLGGERDYSNLKGDTGPLVYPAGFWYAYSAIQYVTGSQVHPAQILFGVLYIVNLGIMLYIYVKTDVVPWWALALLCLSKRMHSIFVLRLFNDCLAMLLLHASLASFLHQRWHLGLIIFSGAVSIKMNVLLYAPPLLLLMLKAMDISGVISALFGAALVQILLGLPFIMSHPVAYISRAFNLGRVFIHFWSVNFKFVPEPIFVSKAFAISLLVVHLVLLAAFAHYRWCRHEGGVLKFLFSRLVSTKLKFALTNTRSYKALKKEHIVTTMFVGNFIGILCARSLHYQFYSWYFHTLPYLLWKTPFPSFLRVILFAGVELCWNVYPSNLHSSALLLAIMCSIAMDVPAVNMTSRAYVTFLAGNKDYVKGVLGLAKGLRKAKSQYPLVVAVLPDVPEEHRKILESQGCIVRDIEQVYPPENHQAEFAMAYYVINYSKLRIFNQCPEKVQWPTEVGSPPPPYFNAGMFVFEPKLSTYNNLLTFLKNTPPTPFAGQDLLNFFFRDVYKPIPSEYNFILAMLWRRPENVKIEALKVVHYCAAGQEENMEREDIKMLVKKWWDIYGDGSLDLKKVPVASLLAPVIDSEERTAPSAA
ncbi:hypothetical protein ACLB2K_014295 [Fragaria x ananassa]